MEKNQALKQLNNVPTKLQPEPPQKSLISVGIAGKKAVTAVKIGLNLPIQKMKEEDALVSISAEIMYVSKVYAGAKDSTLDYMSAELIDFVYGNYKNIGVNEIREAFSQASAGKLGKLDFEAYGEKFTIKSFGDVLNAYVLQRRKTRAIIEKENERLRLEDERKEKKRLGDIQLAKDLAAKHIQFKQSPPDYKSVTELNYKYLDEVAEVGFSTSDKKNAMIEAKVIALKEAKIINKTSISIVAKNKRPEPSETLIKTIAKKLLVVDYYKPPF